MFDHKAYWQKECKKYCPAESEIAGIFTASKIDYIRRHIEIGRDTSILDVGTGTGIFAYRFLRLTDKVIGVDFSEQLMHQNPCKKNLICADTFHLPFKDRSFDIVFSSCLLHHLEFPENAVKEFARASRKYVVLCEPNRNNPAMFLFSLAFKHERGGLKFSKEYLRRIIASSCGRVLDIGLIGSVTPNRMPLSIARLLKPFDKQGSFGLYAIAIGQVN